LQRFPALRFLGHSQPFWSEISADVTHETRNNYPRGPVVPGGRVPSLMHQPRPRLRLPFPGGIPGPPLFRDRPPACGPRAAPG
jgi:hypothetical protein